MLIIIPSWIAFIVMIILIIFSSRMSELLIYFCMAMVGFGVNAYIPVAMQSYVESMYPCQELVLSTSIMIIANVLIILKGCWTYFQHFSINIISSRLWVYHYYNIDDTSFALYNLFLQNQV